MGIPKLLPWLARRNDLPLERAEELWRQADEVATLHAGAPAGREHARLAIEGLLKLVRCEGRAIAPDAALNPMAAVAAGQAAWHRALVQIWINTMSGCAKMSATLFETTATSARASPGQLCG